jgi:hypothetical protein
MTEPNLVTVSSSIDFRDAVMRLDREGHGKWIYVRRTGTSQVYRVIARHTDPFQKIDLMDLFGSNVPPVYMEDFATALANSPSDHPTFRVDVFTR